MPKFTPSLNEERFDFDEMFDTEAEAVAYMQNDLKNEKGKKFYVAEIGEITVEDVANSVDLEYEFERISLNFSENGNCGSEECDWLMDVSPKDEEELNMIVAQWIWKKYKPDCTKFVGVTEHFVN